MEQSQTSIQTMCYCAWKGWCSSYPLSVHYKLPKQQVFSTLSSARDFICKCILSFGSHRPPHPLCIPSSLTVLVLQGQCPEPRGEPGRAALQHGVPALRRQRRSAEGAAAGGDGTDGRTRRTESREDVPEPLQNHAVSQCGMWRHQQCIWGIFDSQVRF